ncbi:MAG: ergothioneine biosynthesis protein EgtB [Gammaproteobacteria bacterium]
MSSTAHQSVDGVAGIRTLYRQTRQTSLAICDPLQDEDFVVQSMLEVSPTKWHLAHTSWFFENFLLKPRLPDYREFNKQFGFLFNSYYYTVGSMHQRAERGMLTRPTVAETRQYRAHVDEHMEQLLEKHGEEATIRDLIVLGINHEQQHQELMLTDIKHVFSRNPLLPAYSQPNPSPFSAPTELTFISGKKGVVEIGYNENSFCFDNEKPRHQQVLIPHALANRLVTNGEYREFIQDGGYTTTELWLSDGWATICEQNWSRPLYWMEDLQQEFTLSGLRPLNDNEPVCHVSYFEADAFARWSGYRLPTEAEWETAATGTEVSGNFLGTGQFHPTSNTAGKGLQQLFGDTWEWTQSPYVCYPGYKLPQGPTSEYNGKFMCNQWVLRGGSCVTPDGHARLTYRNFFYAHDRWQFTGIRLAKDCS